MIHAVFMGSPELAVPSLRVLQTSEGVQVSGVVTQPDRPAGRRRHLRPCAVKAAALEMGLPTFAPIRMKGPEAQAEVLTLLRDCQADLIVVCAYGRILPRALLDFPSLGCFNLHFSLLPRWRGASPLQAALLAGDEVTGVSLQRMVEALDAGPIVAETPPLPIAPGETAGSLGERLALESAQLLKHTLPLLLAGTAPERPQNEAQVTLCRTIGKEEGALDWRVEMAEQVLRKLQAYTPWPGVYSFLGPQRLVFTALESVPPDDAPDVAPDDALADAPNGGPADPTPPGVLRADGLVATAQGWLRIVELQPEGKKPMPWAAFLNGHAEAPGQQLLPNRRS